MTEIARPRGQRSPWQTASTSVISSRSVDLDGAMRAQHLGEHARFAGEPAGVAGDGALRALRASDLEHDHRLADRGRAVERRDVALGLAHGLGEGRDHLGGGIVDQIFDDSRRSG